MTFVVHGSKEEGEDLGGLTVELYSCFFREVLLPDFGLFEGAGLGCHQILQAFGTAAALEKKQL